MAEQVHIQPDVDLAEESPIGEMKLPGRLKYGARAMVLAGCGVGFGVIGAVAEAGTLTTTPPLSQL